MSRDNHSLIACLKVAVLSARERPELGPYRIARVVHDLHKIGQRLHRRYEDSCSYQWADTDAYRERTERLELKASTVAAEAKLGVRFQTEPRGWPLIVTLEQGEVRIGGG
jgi:hypothetical protein